MKPWTVGTALLTLLAAGSANAGTWTSWIDRDNPSGTGDGELVYLMYAEGRIPCDDPIDIEARRKSDGLDASLTGEVVKMSLAGFVCSKADQSDGACDDYEARVLCPDAADGSWSDWINRDTPNGSGDYERADGNWAEGNIDCEVPIAFQTRRASDQVDIAFTGEVYSFFEGNGYTCYNTYQTDGSCDDYESRFFCPPSTPLDPLATGEVDMGDFIILYTAADLSDDGGGHYHVDSGFEVWFGDVWLRFGEATLELVEQNGALVLDGGLVSETPTSNIPAFGVMDLVPGGVDITVGYGGGDLLAGVDAPLNPAYDYFFLSISAGSAEFGGVTVEAPGAVSMTVAIAPDPVTAYMNVSGIFPPVGIVSLDEVGVGFSTADGLLWEPWATWGNTSEMVSQTGNLWLDAVVGLGLNDALSVDFAGEVLGDVDFDAIANGEDGLERLAFNGAVSLSVGPDFFSISQDIADMSVLYIKSTDRWIASVESADLSDGMQGAAQWLDLSASAKLAVKVQSGQLESLVVQSDVQILGQYDLANATITADSDSAEFSGSLDLGTSNLAVDGSIYDGGFSLTGSIYSTGFGGFYKSRARATVTQAGLTVKLGVSVWNFDSGSFGGYTEVTGIYTVANGWCASIGDVDICLAPGGGLTLGGTAIDTVDEALRREWALVSNTVRDVANDVVNDAAYIINQVLSGHCVFHSDCDSNSWCSMLDDWTCVGKKNAFSACGGPIECKSGNCTAFVCW